jgi:hypothetical protein
MKQIPGATRRGDVEPCSHAIRDVEFMEPGRGLMLHCPYLRSYLFDVLPVIDKGGKP